MGADIMSRYTIPELSERELNVQHKTKILEHMRETTITQGNADEITRQHDDFQNARNNSVHIEDQITRSVNSILPRCLNLEEGEKERLLTSLINAVENDDGCTGKGECCRWERNENQRPTTLNTMRRRRDPNSTNNNQNIITDIIQSGNIVTAQGIPAELREKIETMRQTDDSEVLRDLANAKLVIMTRKLNRQD